MTFLFSIPQKVIITLLYNMYCEPSLRVFKNNPSLLSLTSPVYQFLPCCLLLPFSFLNYFINSYHTPTFSIKVLYSLPLWIDRKSIYMYSSCSVNYARVRGTFTRKRSEATTKEMGRGKTYSYDTRCWPLSQLGPPSLDLILLTICCIR